MPTDPKHQTTELAALIVKLWDAWVDQYSEAHNDARIAPILARGKARYQDERRHGFQRASLIARQQAVIELIRQEIGA